MATTPLVVETLATHGCSPRTGCQHITQHAGQLYLCTARTDQMQVLPITSSTERFCWSTSKQLPASLSAVALIWRLVARPVLCGAPAKHVAKLAVNPPGISSSFEFNTTEHDRLCLIYPRLKNSHHERVYDPLFFFLFFSSFPLSFSFPPILVLK